MGEGVLDVESSKLTEVMITGVWSRVIVMILRYHIMLLTFDSFITFVSCSMLTRLMHCITVTT